MIDWVKKSGLAGVLLVLVELLVFLLIVSYLSGIARGDGISDQIEDVDGYLAVIDDLEHQRVSLSSEVDETIVCDELEINHVFELVEGDLYRHRLDQVLIRNRHFLPKNFDHNGRLVRDKGYFYLIDGWAMLSECRRYDDELDRKDWDRWLAGTLHGWPEIEKACIRDKARYWGRFVTPVKKVGEYYVLRLSGPRGKVTLKSKQVTYTKSPCDLETDERKSIGWNRKYNMNGMRNAPTVVGDAGVEN